MGKLEERSRRHKETCLELKAMRAEMAKQLGIDLKQRECTYEGYCKGTCPKCRSEEMQLNYALVKKKVKKMAAVAGIVATASVALGGCEHGGNDDVDGNMEYLPYNNELGGVSLPYDDYDGGITEPEDEFVPDTEDVIINGDIEPTDD